MSFIVELVKAVAALAWPVMLAVVLWKLFPSLKAIVTSRSFSVKIADMQISVQDATEQFRTQIEDLQKQVMLLRSEKQLNVASVQPDDRSVANTVTKPSRILWVDDKPSNNALEIAQLKSRGVDIVSAVSTEDAMATLNSNLGFDAIISDMGRREGGGYRSQAGLVLLKAVRSAGFSVPFFVYSSQSYAARNNAEVIAAGGDGATASPVELLEWVEKKVKRD
jgi:CheY-like chemotaxis protein